MSYYRDDEWDTDDDTHAEEQRVTHEHIQLTQGYNAWLLWVFFLFGVVVGILLQANTR